jgi:hypothetical protein
MSTNDRSRRELGFTRAGSFIAAANLRSMTLSAAILVTLALGWLARPAAAEDAVSGMCHTVGKIALQAAEARTAGKPAQTLIELVRKSATNNRVSADLKPAYAAALAVLERVILAVYQSNIAPDDAYRVYREACEK